MTHAILELTRTKHARMEHLPPTQSAGRKSTTINCLCYLDRSSRGSLLGLLLLRGLTDSMLAVRVHVITLPQLNILDRTLTLDVARLKSMRWRRKRTKRAMEDVCRNLRSLRRLASITRLICPRSRLSIQPLPFSTTTGASLSFPADRFN